MAAGRQRRLKAVSSIKRVPEESMRGKRTLLVLSIACLALTRPPTAGAQEPMRILRVSDFSGDGIEPGEAAALQNLVTSYVIDLKMFRVIDGVGQELALKEAETAVQLGLAKDIAPLSADYILSSKASRIGSLIVFTIDVTKVASGEKKSVADTFFSVNDLILASRRLTLALFEKRQDAPSVASAPTSPATAFPLLSQSTAPPPVAANPTPSLQLVSGTWKGDKNVDRVTILPDGRGFAVLASGVRMKVKASIEGSAVLIMQDQPNLSDFYRPGLDSKSARIVAAAARPWRWVFALSSDGISLNGVKESVFVNVNEKGAVALDNNYVRDAVWTRLFR